MDFRQFTNYIEKNLKSYLPEELSSARVILAPVTKVNDTFLTGVTVVTHEEDVSPVIYLNSYYNQYLDGRTLHHICEEIAVEMAKHKINAPYGFDIEKFKNIENVKDKIALFVVNAEFCKNYLLDTAHVIKEDLALIYKVVLSTGNDEIATITIRNRFLEEWGIDVNILHEYAMQNSSRLLPVKVQTMGEVLRDMYSEGELDFPLDAIQVPMYIITNKTNMNGAGAIFYSDVLERISEKEGTDLYILPSSLHEVIVIPKVDQDFKELEEMVKEVNATAVPLEEWLSNHIYMYDSSKKEICLLDSTSLSEKETATYRELPGHRNR